MNYLYYGDNLDILRRYIKDESVDLIYLDPALQKQPRLQRSFQRAERKQSSVTNTGLQRYLDMESRKRSDVRRPCDDW
jgi:hypothetical protein